MSPYDDIASLWLKEVETYLDEGNLEAVRLSLYELVQEHQILREALTDVQ